MSETGFTIWLTGLSSAGKSTLAWEIKRRLAIVARNVEILDGDEIRTNLSAGLGFSRQDRIANNGRIAFVCSLLTRNGIACVAAAISPYREARTQARETIGNFIEVYVKCPLEVCEQRDVKGLYQLVKEGKKKVFTGKDDAYEVPEHPDVVVETDKETVEESVNHILAKLIDMGYLRSTIREFLISGVYDEGMKMRRKEINIE